MYVLGNLHKYCAMPINSTLFIALLDMGITLLIISGSFVISCNFNGPGKVLKVAHVDPDMKLSKHGHIIYPWKVFLMLILDVEFMLSNFDFWIQGRVSKWEAHPGLIQN